MSLRLLPRRLTVFALLAFLLSSALPPTVAAADPAAYPGPREMATARFRDLDAAVAAGVLDAPVLAEVRTKGRASAIVTFDGDGILAEAQAKAPSGKGRSAAIVAAVRPAFAALKARALGAGSGIRVLREYDALAATHLETRSAAALLRLVNRVEVTGVRQNRVSRATLAQSLDLIDQPEALASGYAGDGTSIAVLDTGLDYTREAFGFCSAPGVPASCKVPYVRDFAPEDFQLDDSVGHGTNVAGIAVGVAPGAKVIGLDVFDGDLAEDSYVLAALNWVVVGQAAHNIRALNMSLGTPDHFTTTCYDSPLEPALASVRAVGVLPVIAAGNSAVDSGTFVNGIAYPACAKGAVSVGAVYDSDIFTADGSYYGCDGPTPTAPDQITCFSQSAPILGLLAPGADITAAGITMGGTSQAAPHVAGAAAVLAEAKLGATPTAIETSLKSTGLVIEDSRNGVLTRRIEVDAAAAYLLGVPSTVTWEPQVYPGPDATWSYDENLASTLQGAATWLHTVRTRDASAQAVEYQRSNNGGATWSPATPVRLNGGSQHGDLAAVAAAGTYVYTAWMRFSSASTPRSVYFRRSSNHGQSWTPAVARTPTSGRVDGPSIAATGNKVYIAYTDSNTGAIRIQRSADNGATWRNLPSPGTTAATAGSGGGLGRWGNPEVAAAGTNVIVAWRASNAGSLKARISTNNGATWQPTLSLDSNSIDHAVAAAGTRLATAWTDTGNVWSKVWNSGRWNATRNVETVGGDGTYKFAYGPAVALFGTGRLDVAWSGCKSSGCDGYSSRTGIDLFWRDSANSGSTWRALPVIIANSAESPYRRINDGADIERVGGTVRHVMLNGWSLNSAGTLVTASRMYMRSGRGT